MSWRHCLQAPGASGCALVCARGRDTHQLLRELVIQVQQVELQRPVVREPAPELQVHELLQVGHAFETHQDQRSDTCGKGTFRVVLPPDVFCFLKNKNVAFD